MTSFFVAALIALFTLTGLEPRNSVERTLALLGAGVDVVIFALIGVGVLSQNNAIVLAAVWVGNICIFTAGGILLAKKPASPQ